MCLTSQTITHLVHYKTWLINSQNLGDLLALDPTTSWPFTWSSGCPLISSAVDANPLILGLSQWISLHWFSFADIRYLLLSSTTAAVDVSILIVAAKEMKKQRKRERGKHPLVFTTSHLIFIHTHKIFTLMRTYTIKIFHCVKWLGNFTDITYLIIGFGNQSYSHLISIINSMTTSLLSII